MSSPTPDNYAVIGNPVAHSKSPDIHALFAGQTQQNMQYRRLLAPLDGFKAAARQFAAEGGKGLNVTVPFKQDAYAFATVLTPRAQVAGAVNTLKFGDGMVLGDNTDGKGLMVDILDNARRSIAGARVLLLGAGGAARGVIQPLLDEQPARLVIANRSIHRAKELASLFSANIPIDVSSFSALKESFDIVINATSAGLSGEMPPVPGEVFGPGSLALDMVYGNEMTPFMRFAAGYGASVRDGFGMLVEQAAESFFVWRGVHPDTGPVFSALRPPS
ncbi:MAG: shikimate dehydrogenase [Burkholderiaceae bacterium]|nr:shikimate dehydrogenase [Burkholderiaceae bacterium]